MDCYVRTQACRYMIKRYDYFFQNLLMKSRKSHHMYLFSEVTELRVINVKKLMYVWSDHCQNFIKLLGLDKGLTNAQLHDFAGFTFEEQFMR